MLPWGDRRDRRRDLYIKTRPVITTIPPITPQTIPIVLGLWWGGEPLGEGDEVLDVGSTVPIVDTPANRL